MLSRPGVVFFVCLRAESSSSMEKAWLSRVFSAEDVTVCVAGFVLFSVGLS